jgi:exonuclease III
VRQVTSTCRPDIIGLQETKLITITPSVVRDTLGADFQDTFVYLPADGTKGGILMAARFGMFHLQQPHTTTNTIIVSVTDCQRNVTWKLTGVYGPQGDLEKKMFLRELRRIKPASQDKWLILGDFNMVYQAQDKSNVCLNTGIMSRFRRALNFLQVRKLT